MRLHVQNLRDSSLHNQETRIVYIQLDRAEQIGDLLIWNIFSVDEVFVLSTNYDLSCHRDFITFLISQGALIDTGVVENDCDCSFCDSSLASFIDQFVETSSTNL